MTDAAHLHYYPRGGGLFAPCGARVGTLGATFSLEKGYERNMNEREEIKQMASSTDEIDRVTCRDCQRVIRETAKAYTAARRNKKVEW